ncbi:MAG: mobile mystery protein A [Proteobacteria bacterium]|nr:mobile mystery protein A [Pseudomonadota bacterium]
MKNEKLARKNLDRRLSKLKPTDEYACPRRGWIHAIREALGMTSAQLAKRLDMSQPGVIQMELAEQRGAITLDTLERAAQALDCTLVYALVPNSSLEDMLTRQAKKVAKERLATVSHTMNLEDQGVSNITLKEQYELILNAQLSGSLRKLWEK